MKVKKYGLPQNWHGVISVVEVFIGLFVHFCPFVFTVTEINSVLYW